MCVLVRYKQLIPHICTEPAILYALIFMLQEEGVVDLIAFVVLDISPHLSFSLRTSRTWLIQLKSLNQMV